MFKFVHQSSTGILTTFGRFSRTMEPGLAVYIPIIQKVHLVSNRLCQDSFKFEVKTKDNVFARLDIAVQYQIRGEDSAKAFFTMYNPIAQMNSYLENDIRSFSSTKNIDDLFESQNEICEKISQNLSNKMKEQGYTIVNTLVVGIEPNSEVKMAMNKINSTHRLKIAAQNEAEANYIKEVKQAEADSKRKELQGQGIAKQRKAILDGYEKGVQEMANKFQLSARDIIDFITKIQHLDMLESIARSPNAKTLFINHEVDNLSQQVMKANIASAPSEKSKNE